MSSAAPQSVTPEDVLAWLKGEFLRRFWHLAIAFAVLNAIAIGIGWPLLQYKFTDYLDQKLAANAVRIDEVRIQTASAEREANTAVARANESTARINEINKDAIKTQSDVSQLTAQLRDIQSQTEELPKMTQNLAEARGTLKDFDRLAAELRAMNGWIRLGMIVPFIGSELPNGFVWADGKESWPSDDWVPQHLRGKPVPNVNGRILRGATDGEATAVLGGSDAVPEHVTSREGKHHHLLPDHSHGLPATTGPIALVGEAITNVRYSIKDDQAGWRNNEPGTGNNHLRVDGETNDEGQHRHTLVGKTTGSGILKTDEDGEHNHRVDPIPFVPSYVAVKYIIRIK